MDTIFGQLWTPILRFFGHLLLKNFGHLLLKNLGTLYINRLKKRVIHYYGFFGDLDKIWIFQFKHVKKLSLHNMDL